MPCTKAEKKRKCKCCSADIKLYTVTVKTEPGVQIWQAEQIFEYSNTNRIACNIELLATLRIHYLNIIEKLRITERPCYEWRTWKQVSQGTWVSEQCADPQVPLPLFPRGFEGSMLHTFLHIQESFVLVGNSNLPCKLSLIRHCASRDFAKFAESGLCCTIRS